MPDWKGEIARCLAPLKLEPAREAEVTQELRKHRMGPVTTDPGIPPAQALILERKAPIANGPPRVYYRASVCQNAHSGKCVRRSGGAIARRQSQMQTPFATAHGSGNL